MSETTSDLLEKMRQHFDKAPYPRIPLEEFPRNPARLYLHNLVTAYYRRNQKVTTSAGKLILDAGCGTGYKSMELAVANPGAKVVGIDLSEESVKLARERLKFHQIDNVEFYTTALEDLSSLGMQFDYINTDEVLYLLPDPIAGLKALRSVLKPEGILRVNFHSSLQRAVYLRSQKFFKLLGFIDGAPQDADVDLVRQMMRCLKPDVQIKMVGWNPQFELDNERVLANHLLQGDKGWIIPEFFAAMRNADLEFISMVDWRTWDLLNLFQNIEELPLAIAMAISDKSIEEQLYLFELLHPVHRLLDLWCGLPLPAQPLVPVSEWSNDDWQSTTVYLHPQLLVPAVKEDLIACVTQLKIFILSQHLRITDEVVSVDSLMAGCLLPLLEKPQPMIALAHHWQKLRPIHPVTLEPTTQAEAFELVKQLLMPLEEFGYILLDR